MSWKISHSGWFINWILKMCKIIGMALVLKKSSCQQKPVFYFKHSLKSISFQKMRIIYICPAKLYNWNLFLTTDESVNLHTQKKCVIINNDSLYL